MTAGSTSFPLPLLFLDFDSLGDFVFFGIGSVLRAAISSCIVSAFPIPFFPDMVYERSLPKSGGGGGGGGGGTIVGPLLIFGIALPLFSATGVVFALANFFCYCSNFFYLSASFFCCFSLSFSSFFCSFFVNFLADNSGGADIALAVIGIALTAAATSPYPTI